MNINHFSLRYGLATVTISLLSALSVQAQTFTGQQNLHASPVGLEASVYPITNSPTTIKLNFNNRSGGGVQVIIQDENGRKVYDEYEMTSFYRRRFDLSAMPAGKYTVVLKKQSDQLSQTFTIEPPTTGYITMGNQPVKKTPNLPIDGKLIVSY